MSELVDLGDNHFWSPFVWDPDLELNPQYAHLADRLPIDAGGQVWHPAVPGSECRRVFHPDDEPLLASHGVGGVTFDLPEMAGDGARWTLVSADPLTLAPSILCRGCGDHGFIREGRWVRA
jgi:hypothetical protein